MTLPASGQIAFSDVNTELGVASNTQLSTQNAGFLALSGKAAGAQVAMSDLYGKSYTVEGQQAYTTAGTYTWIAPAGVTSVSVVAVGAGGGRVNWGSEGIAGGGDFVCLIFDLGWGGE